MNAPELSSAEQAVSTSSRIRAIAGGSAGNPVEWYDWYAYSAFSIYFAPVLFPQKDLTAQLMNSAGIFAVGFLMRPVGGWLFGRLADRMGRKRAMTSSVILMSIGSLMIALAPTYHTIGVWAAAILLFARMLQGLSVGGEYGTSATYLSEMAGARRRGFYSSFQYVTLIGGQLLALGLQLLLQKLVMTPDQLHSWGWRIPFFIGALLSVVAFYLRANLEETKAFTGATAQQSRKGSVAELLRYPRAILTVIGLTLGGTIAFYTYSTYMQKYLVNSMHLSKDTSTLLSFLSLLVFAGVQPLFGMLSDRIGRRPLLLGFGVLGTIGTIPLINLLSGAQTSAVVFILLLIPLLIVSGYTSINAVVKAELFPAEVRALGVGLPYALTVAVFGGSAEYIALYLKNIGHENWFYWFVTVCIFISLVVYVTMKDTKQTSLMKE